MQLIEREEFLDSLQGKFQKIQEGEGHTVFVCGEAGIGKTSLVKAFNKSLSEDAKVLLGTCDSMFAPQPLAPVMDIMFQLQEDIADADHAITDRSVYFSSVFRELKKQNQSFIIFFEDIHWADEATLDFIKFICRRISQLPVLFIMTYRDNEIQAKHPLRNVLGQLIPGSFSRLQLPPLSEEAVKKMVEESGHQRKDIYRITGGNPFYVQELLASYLVEIPDTIRDSILYAYNQCDERSKTVWDILAVTPGGLEIEHLEKIAPDYAEEVARCLDFKILLIEKNVIFFKHDLFRLTIESALSPFLRISMNKKILDLFAADFERNNQLERIIHHAKHANDYDMVVKYAPTAAKHAAHLGAHQEASLLYLAAVEYYNGNDKDFLVKLYEDYAYECYLTMQIKEAIIYTTKAHDIWKEKSNERQIGNSLRFLSRLWWYDGNRKKADQFAADAISVLIKQPVCKEKAMAWSNMSQLKMLADLTDECVEWGEKAIAMAEEIGDEETRIHALNNVGTVLIKEIPTRDKGIAMLNESLHTALEKSYHEHAARAYTNMGSSPVKYRDYSRALKTLDEGIKFCEDHDLNSWSSYMLSWKARLLLETGKWEEALTIAENLLEIQTTPIIKITALVVIGTVKMRRGNDDAFHFLENAHKLANDTMEAQRLTPVLKALLEFEWITSKEILNVKGISTLTKLLENSDNRRDYYSFSFWHLKARGETINGIGLPDEYKTESKPAIKKAVAYWKKTGCPYEEALLLFEGDEEDKKEALKMMQELGAVDVSEKLKLMMRSSGIKSIPRGKRKSTLSNSAELTQREIDIVELLKDGLQNKEIADKLYISPKTVDHHISSILFKLDVNSRTKAAPEAIRLGIIK